ncbi:hypothetical protein [Pseudomonas sp. efr-133-TYG-103a]|uniref:hypothetical protein n=1 Tax=Pseudomonas sp. efr-133-TYG-103a TaxID=3040308 RepID=UPI002554EA70|nr:hypothetical protein [Pseudomonas sp. efr-133-TYG-103a]
MKLIKLIVYGIVLAAVVNFFFVIFFVPPGQPAPALATGAVYLTGFLLGAWLSRYVSWGWSLGGVGGMFAGLVVPTPLMFFFPDTSYEKVLPWLFLSAAISFPLGGYYVDKMFRRVSDYWHARSLGHDN